MEENITFSGRQVQLENEKSIICELHTYTQYVREKPVLYI